MQHGTLPWLLDGGKERPPACGSHRDLLLVGEWRDGCTQLYTKKGSRAPR